MKRVPHAVLVLSLCAFAMAGKVDSVLAQNKETAQKIAEEGKPGVVACMTCHRQGSVGNGPAAFPRLAGQVEGYLLKQLKDFASGRRQNPVMEKIAKGLTEEEMEALAAFASGLESPFGPRPLGATAEAAAYVLIGREDEDQMVQACVACHGPNALGLPPEIPMLAGQHPRYLVKQLKAFRDGERSNDPLGQMQHAVADLSDEDVERIALYLAALRPQGARDVEIGE